MSFRELDLKRSYISYGGDNIAQAFLTPALMHTKLYRRSVGFFSSNVITSIIDGIVQAQMEVMMSSFPSTQKLTLIVEQSYWNRKLAMVATF